MELKNIQLNELNSMIEIAIDQIYRCDLSLIARQASERSIAFRFGCYFTKLLEVSSFSGNCNIIVDMEYNRNRKEPKKSTNFQNGMMPDLIVHKRNSNQYNILVIEFKTYWNNSQTEAMNRVEQKLIDLTQISSIYKFGLGVLIELHMEKNQCEFSRYIGGVKINA
jgi:hypothetical protein